MVYDKNGKVIKSNNGTLPSEVYYLVLNGTKQYFKHKEDAEEMARSLYESGVSPGGIYTETDPEEIQELIDVGYIKSGRFIKSGAGAAYDVIIKDIELDKSGYKVVSDEVTNEEYNEHLAIVEVPVKPCVVTEWSAESYYDGISSDHEMFDPTEDSKIEGGKATLKIWWTEHEEGRYIDNNEFENVNEAVEFFLPSDISIKVKFGAGWFHADLPVENVHLEDYSGEIDLNNDGYGYSTISVDLICPNICQDINDFFKNPEEYYTESYNVYSSKKFIKSAENYGWVVDSSDATKALDMWSEYVGEDKALEDVAKAMSDDTLNENIEWVAQQWGFGEELEELNSAWEKYEFAKEVMGVHDLFENLTQAAGYDELASCLAYIFRMNDFREWDEREGIESARKSIKSSEDSINGLSPRQYRNAVDKASEMIANGERDVQKICKATKLDEDDINAMIADQEEFEESLTSSKKPIKSGRSYPEKALKELEEYFNRSADGWTIYTHKLTPEDEIIIGNICDEYNCDFALGTSHVSIYEITNSLKPIKSGWTFRDAVNTFKSEYGRFNDYWEMQQAWEVFKDGLARDGEITQKQFDSWGNPCTPETFDRWNGPAPEDEFEEDIYSSRKIIKSSVEPGDTIYFWLSNDAKEKYFDTDEDGNPAGDYEEGERIMEILDDNFQNVWADVISSPEDGPYADEFIPSGIYETTPRELKDFFDKGLLDKSVIEVGLGYEETEGDYGDPWYKIKDVVDIDSIINFKD